MKTLALISQKGGSGKTTLTINLAIALAKEGQQVVVLDLDPQFSTAAWSKIRKDDNPVFVPTSSPEFSQMAARAERAGADYLLVDTAPKDEKASLQAAKLADVVLIPCQPSTLDLHAVSETVNTANLANRPALFILNNCKTSSTLSALALDALSAYSTPVAPVHIGNRVDFVKSLLAGQGVVEFASKSKAAKEIFELLKFTKQQIGTNQ